MKYAFLIACLLISLTGCATTQTTIAQKASEARQPPAQAMVECPLPDPIKGMKMEDWILKAFESAQSAKECQLRQKELIEWIRRSR